MKDFLRDGLFFIGALMGAVVIGIVILGYEVFRYFSDKLYYKRRRDGRVD